MLHEVILSPPARGRFLCLMATDASWSGESSRCEIGVKGAAAESASSLNGFAAENEYRLIGHFRLPRLTVKRPG